jgi:2-polyprenyl-3-methyl-5-hydroxy-6-metoxy-1,4-benzoquinol methylase
MNNLSKDLDAPAGHWSKLAKNPNQANAKNACVEKLKKARHIHGIQDRVGWICSQVQGLRVLDIGVVAHTAERAASSEWLHGRLASVAGSCLGIDILEKDVQALQGQGYNIRVHDLTHQPVAEKFEIAVMGDVLEHLSNPGNFLENLKASLVEGGRVIVSVPNPWYLAYPLSNLQQGGFYHESADHVAWYDANTILELFGRAGFTMESYRGVVISRVYTWKSKLLLAIVPFLIRIGFAHELFSKTIIYVFRKAL